VSPADGGGPRLLAAPASLKGVLGAAEAATALVRGARAAGCAADRLPVADGGEGTLDALAAAAGGAWLHASVPDAFGRARSARWLELPDGTAAVEAAEAIPLDPSRLDPLGASSRGLGELIAAALAREPRGLLVCLGGTATVDGGAGLLEVLTRLPADTRVACDVDLPLLDAALVFAPQKGATPELVDELAARLASRADLRPHAELPGAGAAGGLGASLASLGAELTPGAALVLDLVGFDPAGYDLVVTGEGTVDATTARGKAPGEVARRCAEAGTRCVVFGGRVDTAVPGAETVALSGDPARAWSDLEKLGAGLARRLRAELLGE
jgi:glycerate 2-kinase